MRKKAQATRGPRARLDFKQRNVSRAVRACEAAGKEIGAVEITKDGTIRVIVGKSRADAAVNPWDEVLTDAANKERPA